MSIFEDWKFCLIMAMWMLIVGLFTGDIVGLIFFFWFLLCSTRPL